MKSDGRAWSDRAGRNRKTQRKRPVMGGFPAGYTEPYSVKYFSPFKKAVHYCPVR